MGAAVTRKPPSEHQLDVGNDAVRFDSGGFDNLVASQGLVLEHWRAVPCAQGRVNGDDGRRPGPHEGCCWNGYHYFLGGQLMGVSQQAGMAIDIQDQGDLLDATAVLTISSVYNSDERVEVGLARRDRLYAMSPKVWGTKAELVDLEDGVGRFQFPAETIELVYGASGKPIGPGGYTLAGQRIAVPGEKVVGVRYRYRPYWYVSRVLHEIRVFRLIDGASGEPGDERAPLQVVAQREYFYEASDQVGSAAQDRKVSAPPGYDPIGKDELGDR